MMRVWRLPRRGLRSPRERFPARRDSAPRWLRSAALTAVLVNFVAIGLAGVNWHVDPDEQDTGRYLNAALFVREHGGALALPAMCMGGVYREAIQQPLYHALLAPLAVRRIDFFFRAKLLTLCIGAAVVVATFLVGRSVFGDGVALAGALCTAISHGFIVQTTMVACESLLMLWVLLGWGSAIRWARGSDDKIAPGVWLGLAYLTKASALLMAPAFVVAAASRQRGRGRLRRFAVWTVVAAAIASPILARNTVVYSTPFYNPHSARMWLDDWEHSYRPDFDQSPPNVLDYLRKHSLGHIAKRCARGARGNFDLLVGRVLPPYGPDRSVQRKLGICLLALAALGLVLDPILARSLITITMLLAFGAAFSWYYEVVPGARFLLPLGPLIHLYAVAGLLWLLRSVFHPVGWRLRAGTTGAALAAIGAVLMLSAVSLREDALRRNPLESARVAPGFYQLRAWLQDRLRPGETYAHGPSHSYVFGWNSRPALRGTPLPLLEDLAALDRWLTQNGIRYLVIDAETARRRGRLLREIVARPASDTGPIRLLTLPRKWRLATLGPQGDPHYAVLDVTGGPI